MSEAKVQRKRIKSEWSIFKDSRGAESRKIKGTRQGR